MKKKVAFIGMALLVLTSCGKELQENNGIDYEENKEIQNDVTDSNVVQESMENTDGNGDIIFDTEYTIEDYCNGVFIISKSNGLLYGALNMEGEEIIPVQYDKISLVNEDNVVDGVNENIYIQTEYEDSSEVYNNKGIKMFDERVEAITFPIGDAEENSPLFMSSDYVVKNVYNEDGTVMFSRDATSYTSTQYGKIDIKWVSPRMYILIASDFEMKNGILYTIYKGIYLQDIDGNTLQEWDDVGFAGFEQTYDNTYYIYFVSYETGYYRVAIKEDGSNEMESITEEEFKQARLDEAMKSYDTSGGQATPIYYLGENNKNKLYTTNDTWKYVDGEENPIYDDRYFSLGKHNHMYLLSNEDNEVCIITQNGKKTVDYGHVTYSDTGYMFNGMLLMDNNVFADRDSVCFVENNNGLNQVYYFSSKE